MTTPRRSFLGRLAALLAVGAAPSTLAAATRPGVAGPTGGSERWPDERWLEQLANREHKMIMQWGAISDGLALRRAVNFYDVLNTDYQIPDGRIGLTIGCHSASLAVISADAMWAKHGFGTRFNLKDAQGNALTANSFKGQVDALVKRGVQFIACNRSLLRLSRDLAGQGGDATAVHAELSANMLPGVLVVPALIVALSRAQSRGVPYVEVI